MPRIFMDNVASFYRNKTLCILLTTHIPKDTICVHVKHKPIFYRTHRQLVKWTGVIVYSTPSGASQPIRLHRYLNI